MKYRWVRFLTCAVALVVGSIAYSTPGRAQSSSSEFCSFACSYGPCPSYHEGQQICAEFCGVGAFGLSWCDPFGSGCAPGLIAYGCALI